MPSYFIGCDVVPTDTGTSIECLHSSGAIQYTEAQIVTAYDSGASKLTPDQAATLSGYVLACCATAYLFKVVGRAMQSQIPRLS